MYKLQVAEGLALLILSLIPLSLCLYSAAVEQFDVQPLPTDDNVYTIRTDLNDSLKCIYPTDCYDVMGCGRNKSGAYRVFPFGVGDGFLVHCDMKTEGGGWLVFQRRQDGAISFYENWSGYTNGFGVLLGDFWLGLEKIHLLTSQRRYELLVNLDSFDNGSRYSRHDRFYISDESHQYQLLLGTYSGDAGDSLGYHNGYKFSTIDQDNDDNQADNYARTYVSGWWFFGTPYANLNGPYRRIDFFFLNQPVGTTWYTWSNSSKTMKFVEMKFRPYV